MVTKDAKIWVSTKLFVTYVLQHIAIIITAIFDKVLFKHHFMQGNFCIYSISRSEIGCLF